MLTIFIIYLLLRCTCENTFSLRENAFPKNTAPKPRTKYHNAFLNRMHFELWRSLQRKLGGFSLFFDFVARLLLKNSFLKNRFFLQRKPCNRAKNQLCPYSLQTIFLNIFGYGMKKNYIVFCRGIFPPRLSQNYSRVFFFRVCVCVCMCVCVCVCLYVCVCVRLWQAVYD